MRFLLLLLLIITTAAAPIEAVEGAPKSEIEFLLRYVETANARFIRNGSEYDAKAGAAHLRDKLAQAGDRVKTAEDFIKGVAAKSSLSGKPYLVKFPDGKTLPTEAWLTAALAEHRRSAR